MPLHLNSITNDAHNTALLSYILGPAFQNVNSGYATPDKLRFVGRSEMIDRISGDVIGHFVYSIWSNLKEHRNEIQDLDITLCNSNPTSVHFLERLQKSEDATDYYDAETADSEQHFQLETVNKYAVYKDLTDTTRDVFISAFPFELSIYDSIDAFNKHLGFKKNKPIGKTGFKTSGLSETFLSPGGILSKDYSNEVFSMVVGTVASFRDVSVDFGGVVLNFMIAQVKTAFGTIPVAIGREVFDVKKLKVGKLVAMNADIKADLAAPEVFRREKKQR